MNYLREPQLALNMSPPSRATGAILVTSHTHSRALSWWLLGACATFATCLTITAASDKANATNYSGTTGEMGCSSFNEADNATHTYRYVDIEQSTLDSTVWARANVLDPTDVNTQYDNFLDSLTDVVVRDQQYDTYCGYTWYNPSIGQGGTIGLAVCDSVVSPGANWKCEQHTVRINLWYTASAGLFDRRSLACHENGHTLGLKHRDGGCMKTDAPHDTTNFATHDRDHVNANY